MQRITTASKRSLAMNYRCCCAIVRSEQTHTLATTFTGNRLTLHSYRHATNYACSHAITCNELPLLLRPRACNELQLLLRHRAVRKNTLAKYVYASKRSRAMNYRCMQWITAAAASSCMQWITATAAPSCGQKKHTRWRSTSMLRSDHVQWITAACNELQLLLRHRAVRRNTHAGHDIPCYQLHRS